MFTCECDHLFDCVRKSGVGKVCKKLQKIFSFAEKFNCSKMVEKIVEFENHKKELINGKQ